VVALSILIASTLSIFTLGGVQALQQFLIGFAVMAAVIGITFMMFSYNLAKIPAWPLLLLGEATLAICVWTYSDDIAKALGVKQSLLPFSLIGGAFSVNPWTLILGVFLICLALAVYATKVKK